ncbi:large ribosomal subunit protein bL27m [Culicoides brevitarsis]|uniref:large ribosomal subunit protein bL27m n=1 Tax=Culicoides brevitarsis TaxID=469753 RepID=UPI00307C5DA0
MSFRILEAVKSKLLQTNDTVLQTIRNASKKTAGSTRNRKSKTKGKHRGIKVWDGEYVSQGSILAMQFMQMRFHPGLNVGIGKNGNLFALEHGRVVMSCEKIDPNWDHTFIKHNYAGREGQTIYKKVFNIIPLPQHNRFKLVDEV